MANAYNQQDSVFITQLRRRMSDLDLSSEQTQDKHLIRWLRARDMNVKDAELMFRKHIDWNQLRPQKSEKGDSKGQHAVGSFEREYPVSVSGEDLEGRPVVIIHPGLYNFKGAADNGIQADVSEHFFTVFDKLFDMVGAKSGENAELTRAVGVVDFEGFSWRQCTSLGGVGLIMSLVRDFEANYPEVVEAAYVVNAPAIFQLLYKLLSPVFAPKTLAKFRFFGTNEVEWKIVLGETIEEDQLPPKYGGTSTVNLLDASDSR